VPTRAIFERWLIFLRASEASTRSVLGTRFAQGRVIGAGDGVDKAAGTLAKGQFACTTCGNRVTVHQVLPRCMVCGERLWERADWSPFARSEGAALDAVPLSRRGVHRPDPLARIC
jgi:hypothetical protein